LSYSLGEGDDPDGAASAKPRNISLICVTGTKECESIMTFLRGGEEKYYFDGTNVYESIHAAEHCQPR